MKRFFAAMAFVSISSVAIAQTTNQTTSPATSPTGNSSVAQTSESPDTGGVGKAPDSVRVKIEADGYRNVQGLAMGADGRWHGRALRGNTEVAVTVDSHGTVAAQ